MSHPLRYQVSCQCDICIGVGIVTQQNNGNAEPFKPSIKAVVVPGVSSAAALVANIAIQDMIDFRPEDFL